MSMFQRPRGTRDFSPSEMGKRRQVESQFRLVCERFGFKEIATPTFENLALFTTKSGPSVIDETYAFKDKGGRDIALRPEFTPSVVRMYINEMQKVPKPIKIFCFGNCFRYDEPQKGRYREFYQFNAEIIGGDEVSADAEIITLAVGILEDVTLRNFELRIGYINILRELTKGLPNQQRILQAIDKKDFDKMRELLKADGAPALETKIMELASIRGDDSAIEKAKAIVGDGKDFEYIEAFVKRLKSYGMKDYVLDFGLVRGLDYYTGMVFEIDYPGLGAEKQICGGGSYKLIELFGGEKIFSTGFAMGFDRIVLVLEDQRRQFPEGKVRAYVIPMDDSLREASIEVATSLRKSGIITDMDLSTRTPSKALKYANSINAEYAILLKPELYRENKVTMRNLESGAQEDVTISSLSGILKK